MVRLQNGPGLGAKKGPVAAPSKTGSTQNMSANIKVVVRVRPLNMKEIQSNNRVVVDVVDDKMLVFDPKQETRPFFYQGVQQPNKNFLKRANKELKFVFDDVCGQEASNQDVFETTTKEIIASLMEGYNCSVFAYGATGAGKTFTMIGTLENPGITYLTMEHLFYTIDSFEKDREFDIGVSYIEVYNENVYDLLKPSSTPLQLREDSKYGVMVAGLSLHSIRTARELLNMLEDGNKNRTQHPTDANAESSRSHAVFQVYVKMRYKISSQLRMVKLSMIDLAGSERASATGCKGDRFKEGANINKSLLSLGNCINKLADGSNYIPYRDSKLTRLLKDSLGGNCKTVMIANVSPSSITYEDTYNTLKYAARANKIQLSIKKNIVDGDMRLSQYVKINEELRKKIKELEAKLSLSSLKTVKESDGVKEKMSQQWRQRIQSAESAHTAIESRLITNMCQQRVLALRQRLRTRAFQHLADLAHRCSSEHMEQMCVEDIPRQERAAESYVKQCAILDTKVLSTWGEWDESRKKLNLMYNQAVTDHPELIDFVQKLQTQAKLRLVEARDNLRYKLLAIEHQEIKSFTEYVSDMPSMLKKLYLTLKGYDRATPALTNEYLDIMKKAKSVKGIVWSDEVPDNDDLFKFVSTLDLEKPISAIDFDDEENIDLVTDSEDLTDIENREPLPSAKKRKGTFTKGTPMKLINNETIIINDSFESMDVKQAMNSAKKVKKELSPSTDVDNYSTIDPNCLNSTFVMANKMDWKKTVKVEPSSQPIKTLMDRTNTITRTNNLNDRAKIVKPIVGKAIPFKRNPAPVTVKPVAGFGSGVARDGTSLQRNVQGQKATLNEKSVGFKAVRAKERMQTHPYSRPALRK
ncbi:kinesin-like protein KIF18A isoform X1 [Pieris brassicae]|uniref:kinesin-like protein KIF18A isoform X1 n=1 Tax=Pieris brassicae TaxID=7116 RepID=UPI001E65E383|nr:kinesin-like protein KIF18A isoform X1 [Pieris brassicae]